MSEGRDRKERLFCFIGFSTFRANMSKRITDFFSSVSNKRQKNTDNNQDIPDSSEQTDQNKYPLDKALTTFNQSSQDIESFEKSRESEECTSSSFKASQPSTSFSKPNSHSASDTKENGDTRYELYKGAKLNSSWLIKTYPCFEKVKLMNRNGIKCTTCFKQIQEAKKFSKNGRVQIADGIRVDGEKELQRIVDHLTTESHIAAENLEQMQKKWLSQSDKHPWVKTLKHHNAEKIKILIEIAVDVYNDSRQLTLSANSWPSRSLSKIHSDIQIAAYKDEGLDAPFEAMNPSSNLLQYRTPIIYAEMLDIVGDLVMKNIKEELEEAECFAIQVDGSVDKYGVDNKFITARFFTKNKEMKSVFLGESKSEKRGAEGLLDAIKILFKDLNIDHLAKEKLTGLTTDGENANTGKNSGLWVRMKDYLQRDILCIWCVAHRSDLVLSDVEMNVTEVKHWKQNLKAIASFYRGSALRFDELQKIAIDENKTAYRFPAFFEIRFAEHLINLSKAVWNNLYYMQKHWELIIKNSDASKTEKAQAKGFLRIWKKGSQQQKITCLMMDVLRQIEKLQKEGQRSLITITDIEATKNIVQCALSMMQNEPYPGGFEEEMMNELETGEEDEDEAQTRRWYRCWSAVRNEVIQSCNEFLGVRLASDQQEIVSKLNTFVNARTAPKMISTMRMAVTNLFGLESVGSFADNVIALYASEKLPPPLDMKTPSAILYHFLKVSDYGSVFSKLVQTYMCLTPHSSGPERAVSVHTTLKTNKQSSYSRKTLNSRMYIALNGVGTAFFDPRPAVARFLEAKERRRKLPNEELYKNHEFIKKFFSKDSTF